MPVVYDISVRLDDAITMPGDPPYDRPWVKRIAAGNSCNLSALSMSLHRGTHIDTPLHFLEGVKRLDDYPLERFMLPAMVVETDAMAIGPEHLPLLDGLANEALLFKTDNSREGWVTSGTWRESYAHLTLDAARAIVAAGVGMVGIDYATIEARGDKSYPVHKTLLSADVLILEGLNLAAVPPGRNTLHCLPLVLPGAEASPVRAVLMA